MPKPTLTEGMKATMRKRREAARDDADEPYDGTFNYAHFYSRDIGILLKRIGELEDER